jgi:hypothetical protein
MQQRGQAMSTEETTQMVQLYLDEIGKKYDEKVQIRFKSESKLLKFLRPILELFNKNFWHGYVTTIGSTIWVPDDWFERGDLKSRLQTTAHEVLHVKQGKDQGAFLHAFLYLFPQSLAPLALLSLLAIPFGIGWLWCLLFLLCLAPLPAPFRYLKELEAYRVKVLFFIYVWSSTPEMLQWAKETIIVNLSKSDYYFTWPFPKWIQKDLDKIDSLNKSQYREILDFLERHDLRS